MTNNKIIYMSREFRDHLSEAFQNVIEGKTVIVKRFNRTFILMSEETRQKEIEQMDSISKRVAKLEKNIL